MDPELKAALDSLSGRANAFHESVTERLDEFETRLERSALRLPGDGDDSREAKAARKTFNSFLRRGPEALDVGERKALIISDDTQGGYLAPAEFVVEILKDIVQFSPVRQAARVGQTAASEVLIPKRTGTPTARWVGETEIRTEAAPSYGQLRIQISEGACFVDVSNQLMEDAAVDFGAELAFDLAEEFGRLEGLAFVSGDGNKKPVGFMTDPAIGFTVSGSAADVTGDGLIDALYALQPAYRSRSTWMMNGTTLAKIRKFKDTTGQYIWAPGFAGQPETILSRPVVEAVDMPDVGAGAFPIVIGDFQQYRIYDRLQLSIMRDPYSLAMTGQTRFHARRRVGGGVAKPTAFRKIKCSA
jgi:HK97 family phage major capsid protein